MDVIQSLPCSVQPWVPDFIASKIKIKSMLVWIRFPSLRLEYYDESLLLAMAAVVGTPVRVDFRTMDAMREIYMDVSILI